MVDRNIWPQFSFTTREHLTSTKLNNLLKIMEDTRKGTGPYSLSKLVATGNSFQAVATGLYLQLDDDPTDMRWGTRGSGPNQKTDPKFTVTFYDGITTTVSGYARWSNVRFQKSVVEGVTGYRVHINATNWSLSPYGNSTLASGTVSAGHVNLSTVNVSGFLCFLASG